jgi:hypothetical protein
MYRVELKDYLEQVKETRGVVPNVPCGLESFKGRQEAFSSHAVLSQLCGMKIVGGGKRFKLLNTV